MALGSSGRRIVVEFVGDASSLKSGIADGEKSLQGFGGKARAVGSIAGKVLAGGLVLAGVAAVKATQAAADDEAAQAQLAQQLKQAAGATDAQIASTEDWITAQGKATGISDDDLRPALARLATATGSVSEAQKLAALAMDVSAGSGKSYQQVTEALAKAQNGNIGALGRLGIATKDAQGKTKSLTAITQDLANKYNGAAANAAETTAGKQKILTTQMHELQEQIGANLLPVMVKLSQVGLQVVGWISKNTTTAGILVGALGALLAVTAAVGAATKAWAAIQAVVRAATVAWTAVQWLLNAALTANPLGLVIVLVGALIGAVILAYKHSETFRKIVQAAFGAVAKAAGAAVDFIKAHWRLILAILTGPVGIAVGLISKHWNTIKLGAQVVVGWVRDHWPPIKDALVRPFSIAKGIISSIWDTFKSGFQRTKDSLVTTANNLRDSFKAAFDAIKAPIDAAISAVQGLIDKIGSLIDKIKSIPHPDLPGLGKVSSGLVGRGSTSTALSRTSGAAGSGGLVVINVVALDPAAAGRAVVDSIRKVERQTGRKLLVSPA